MSGFEGPDKVRGLAAMTPEALAAASATIDKAMAAGRRSTRSVPSLLDPDDFPEPEPVRTVEPPALEPVRTEPEPERQPGVMRPVRPDDYDPPLRPGEEPPDEFVIDDADAAERDAEAAAARDAAINSYDEPSDGGADFLDAEAAAQMDALGLTPDGPGDGPLTGNIVETGRPEPTTPPRAPAAPQPDAAFAAREGEQGTLTPSPAQQAFAAQTAPADAVLGRALDPQTSLDLGVTAVRKGAPTLVEKLLIPPFTTLDTRAGYWQERRRQWLSLGIRGETTATEDYRPDGSQRAPSGSYMGAAKGVKGGAANEGHSMIGGEDGPGRKADDEYRERKGREKEDSGGRQQGLIYDHNAPASDPAFYDKKRKVEAALGHEITTEEFRRDHYRRDEQDLGQSESIKTGTSVFDPVLCEIAYRWFSGLGASVLDPFAGGAIRGIVAAALGRRYIGVELRPEQLADNVRQGHALFGPDAEWNFGRETVMPQWVEGDATQLRSLLLPEVDLVFSCHPAGTRILTERGIAPIEQVREGERVMTHVGRWRPVTETLTFAYTGEMVQIEREYRSLPLHATIEHPLLVRRAGSLDWRCAGDVRPGDHFVEPREVAPAEPIDGEEVWSYREPIQVAGKRGRLGARTGVGPRFVRATPEAARLLGYYLAEGYARRSVSFCFGPTEDAYIDDVIALSRSVLNSEAVERPPVKGDRVRVVGCSGGTSAAQFVTDCCGSGAKDKRFPSWAWRCSDGILGEFIRGAWRGDGSTHNGVMSYATVSPRLADDIRRALLRLGILASIRLRERKANAYCESPAPVWELKVTGESAERLAVIVGVELDRKPRRPGRSPEMDERYIYYEVKSVERYRPEGIRAVYNLEVADDHSYIAEGVASHNCPPYADLERYSDDPRDLSNMPYYLFRQMHASAIAQAAERLKKDRFFFWVIGEARDKKTGAEYGVVADTIGALKAAGLQQYNTAVLINSVGSGALRAQLIARSRKLTRLHQHVLVFVKGDPKKAAEACGTMELLMHAEAAE